MGINECSKPASKSSWESQDFGDVNMVLKMVHFRKSSRPQWVKFQGDWDGEGACWRSKWDVFFVMNYVLANMWNDFSWNVWPE